MSSFLSRLHSQHSQALVFRPYPDSPPPYKRPSYSSRPTDFPVIESKEFSEEREREIEIGREQQVNLLSALAETAVTVARTVVRETPKYQQAPPLSKSFPLPLTPSSPRKPERRPHLAEKSTEGRRCHLCGKMLNSARSLGGHISGSHTKKAKAMQQSGP